MGERDQRLATGTDVARRTHATSGPRHMVSGGTATDSSSDTGDLAQAFSPAYIAGWMAQKGADFQTALNKAVKAADTILNGDWPDNDATERSTT